MGIPNAAPVAPRRMWMAESVRFSAFFAPGAQIDPTVWWERAVGRPADSHQVNRTTGFTQDDAPFHNRRLIMVAQQFRVDWLVAIPIQAEPSQPVVPEQPLTLRELLRDFREIIFRWFGIGQPISRIAFGAAFQSPVNSAVEGYRELAHYIPSVRIIPEDTADFLYQINRPRRSEAYPAIMINRLAKWQVSIRGAAQFILGAAEFQTGMVQLATVQPNEFAIETEVDINTQANYQAPLPQDQLFNIYDELVRHAITIADQGDVI